MAGILQILNNSFKSFLDQGDPRVKDWPLMQTPFPGMAMIAAYIYFVKVAGPQFMAKRKPFGLRMPMAVYSFLLLAINLFLFLGIAWYSYSIGYSLKCQPVDYSDRIEAVRLAQIGYLYYLTKFIEFADTIFFVLRKKNNQISALHVIHHSIVPFSLWFGLKFAPGGYNTLFPFLNCFVHVVMYAYYGLAALGEKYKKYLFWKKYLTFLQLGQFVCVIIYAISLHINKCDVHPIYIAANFFHALLFLVLFLNFFIKSYVQKPPARSKSVPVSSEEASRVKTAHRESILNEISKRTVPENGQVSRHRRNIHNCCDEEDCLCKSEAAFENGSQNGAKFQ